MPSEKKAYIFGISAVLMWSTVASAFKIALFAYSVTELLLISTFVSFLFLLLYSIFSGNIYLLKNINYKQFLKSALLGFLNPFLYYMLLFFAYSQLKAQEALILNYSWVIVLIIFSAIFLKQKVFWFHYLSIIISFCGLAAASGINADGNSNTLGIIAALSTSLIWSSYFIANIKDNLLPEIRLLLNFGFGFIFILIYSIFTLDLSFVFRLDIRILSAVYIGIFEMGLTFLLWLRALKESETAAKVSNLIYLSPVLSMLWISIIIGERIAVSSIIGLGLILSSIVFQYYFSERRKKIKEI